MDIDSFFPEKIAIIGNFPYNISTQIFFKTLKHRQKVVEITGMLQKEVAEAYLCRTRLKNVWHPQCFTSGILSTEYLFTVPEHVFSPPPKVKSGV